MSRVTLCRCLQILRRHRHERATCAETRVAIQRTIAALRRLEQGAMQCR